MSVCLGTVGPEFPLFRVLLAVRRRGPAIMPGLSADRDLWGSGAEAEAKKRRSPLWARLCALFGSVLMVSARRAHHRQVLIANYAGAVAPTTSSATLPGRGRKPAASDIKGPLNLLLVGIDPRDDETRAAVRLDRRRAHPGRHEHGLPVLHPPGPVRRHPGVREVRHPGPPREDQLRDGAGSQVDGKHDAAQGFELLAKTVRERHRHQTVRRRRRSSTSAASRRSSRPWAASDGHRHGREVRAPATERQTAAPAGALPGN